MKCLVIYYFLSKSVTFNTSQKCTLVLSVRQEIRSESERLRQTLRGVEALLFSYSKTFAWVV